MYLTIKNERVFETHAKFYYWGYKLYINYPEFRDLIGENNGYNLIYKIISKEDTISNFKQRMQDQFEVKNKIKLIFASSDKRKVEEVKNKLEKYLTLDDTNNLINQELEVYIKEFKYTYEAINHKCYSIEDDYDFLYASIQDLKDKISFYKKKIGE